VVNCVTNRVYIGLGRCPTSSAVVILDICYKRVRVRGIGRGEQLLDDPSCLVCPIIQFPFYRSRGKSLQRDGSF
jgi:hypothetical protein